MKEETISVEQPIPFRPHHEKTEVTIYLGKEPDKQPKIMLFAHMLGNQKVVWDFPKQIKYYIKQM